MAGLLSGKAGVPLAGADALPASDRMPAAKPNGFKTGG